MILSNVSIHEALDQGWLVITPEPGPRFPAGGKCPYKTSAVDLTLGEEISFFQTGVKLPFVIDLREGEFAKIFGPFSETCAITAEQPFVLDSGRFVLARTRELVRLPLLADAPSLAARVEGRSSYARCGVLVHFTAPTIHAGFEGHITLEVMNLGPLAVSLFPGSTICQLIVEQVHGVPFRNDSQFQGQRHPGGNLPSH